MITFAATGPSAYWYLTRGTGVVALILLTISVALGVANVRRLRTEHVPRFVIDAVHRNVSLLATAFMLVHIVTSLLDGYAPIRLIDAIVPFTSAYRPVWLGLGAVAVDLLLAVVITSLLRRRLGYRAWRITHWAAYASWPVALLHSLGTGSDIKAGWMLAIVIGCVTVVIAAVLSRVAAGGHEHPRARVAALVGAALVPLGLLVWLPSGPLAAGWAKQAGTPASLLRTTNSTSSASSSSATSASNPSSFTADALGSVQQGSTDAGLTQVNISLSLSGQTLNRLEIQLQGQPLDGGGLQMTSSSVSLGRQSDPGQYRGRVTSLDGTNITARVSDGSGHVLTLVAQLQISADGGSASGTVSARP